MIEEKPLQEPQVLISEQKIRERLQDLAKEIEHDLGGQSEDIVAVCILKGSFVFFSDLIRKLDLPLSCEFLGVSSYGEKMVSSGEVKLTLDLHAPIEGKHVIVIEDIVDTGLTLQYIMNSLRARKPKSIRSCALLLKPDSLKIPIDVDYLGFRIGSEFVVGYGIDFAGRYRNLPYIGYLEKGH